MPPKVDKCYTRTKKDGGKYTTCLSGQKKAKETKPKPKKKKKIKLIKKKEEPKPKPKETPKEAPKKRMRVDKYQVQHIVGKENILTYSKVIGGRDKGDMWKGYNIISSFGKGTPPPIEQLTEDQKRGIQRIGRIDKMWNLSLTKKISEAKKKAVRDYIKAVDPNSDGVSFNVKDLLGIKKDFFGQDIKTQDKPFPGQKEYGIPPKGWKPIVI
tara:strand:- start:965 stop:1600 length:636 start_codon:yes stop_codon:yes gene_type:complete